MPLITLTTDFGLSDNYVGVMKGVVASICPSATVIDITHGIPPRMWQRLPTAYIQHTVISHQVQYMLQWSIRAWVVVGGLS